MAYRKAIALILFLILAGCASQKPFCHTVTIPQVVVDIRDDCNGYHGLAWKDTSHICIRGTEEGGDLNR